MEFYILTKCISDNGKCEPSCEVYPTEQIAKEAIETGIKESIQDCVDKYGVNPNNIEPKNDQGTTIVQMYDGKYAWKIKKVNLTPNAEGNVLLNNINLLDSGKLFILLHAHNRGYISYAVAQVFSSMSSAKTAMELSFKSSLEMWSLMQGKDLFKNVKSEIGEGDARVQLGGEIEVWKIEEKLLPEQKS